VTQLARPLVRAVYGVALHEPLGAEFSCSGRFASHCLEQDIWDRDMARFAIDLWLRTEAVADSRSARSGARNDGRRCPGEAPRGRAAGRPGPRRKPS
jgi:hypothetical protein